MISYNEFAVVPGCGIICVKEGSLLRVYFDIAPYEPVVSDNQPEDIQNVPTENNYVCQVVDVQGQTYADIVSAIVNDRYSADDVQALQANFIEAKDAESEIDGEKRQEYLAEYASFQAWRKKAKEIAIKVLDTISE